MSARNYKVEFVQNITTNDKAIYLHNLQSIGIMQIEIEDLQNLIEDLQKIQHSITNQP